MDHDVYFFVVFYRSAARFCGVTSAGGKNGFAPFHYVRDKLFSERCHYLHDYHVYDVSGFSKTISYHWFYFFVHWASISPIFGTDFGKGATRWYALGLHLYSPPNF